MKRLFTLVIFVVIAISLPANSVVELTRSFEQSYNDWLRHWQEQNIEEYLNFYHPDFRSTTSRQNFEQWSAHKRRVFNPANPVTVEFTEIKRTPSTNFTTIAFEALQDYRSHNYSDFGKKTMTWRYENGEFKIVSEDWVVARRPTPPPEETEPPVVVPDPRDELLRQFWASKEGQVPFEYINFLFPISQNYDPYVIFVEKKDQYAALYRFSENKRDVTLMHTYHISSGEVVGNKVRQGDLKTPEGLYVTLNFIPESALEPKYGTGAWVLNYPNEIDRLRRKTGSGIWIHGSDMDIIPRDTEGCIRFDNDVILYFKNTLNFRRVPVLVNEQLQWTTVAELDREVQNIQNLITAWKESWEAQDINRYLNFYKADEFVTHKQNMNYDRWVAHKTGIFSPEKQVRLVFTDYNYYYADNLLLVTFHQDYSADAYRDFGRKQLVLQRGNDTWKIIQEEWTAARNTSQ